MSTPLTSRYASYLKQIVDSWPRPVAFCPVSVAPSTLATRLRMCMSDAEFNAKHETIAHDCVVTLKGNVVTAGPQQTKQHDAPTQPSGLLTIDYAIHGDAAVKAVMCLHDKRILVEPTLVINCPDELSTGAFDVVVQPKQQGQWIIV